MDLDDKILVFLSAISGVYKEEDDRESFPKLKLNPKDLTDDITAMLTAQYLLYQRLTGNEDEDIVGFTHLLNRLAIQYIMKSKDAEE